MTRDFSRVLEKTCGSPHFFKLCYVIPVCGIRVIFLEDCLGVSLDLCESFSCLSIGLFTALTNGWLGNCQECNGPFPYIVET